ncbi:MAG TPA: LysM peptidoglycan-binding domain-containing protein [Ferruginibacter sp.]|nr:LysM peptidoglycan-binding domain-containing protein [Ferruginibacter sp.]
MKNLLAAFLLLPLFINAQDKPLMVEGVSPNIYLVHTTTPKETFYSIGRIYNISPKEIAPFNNLVLENGLSIGQVIKVPLKEVNFSQDGITATDEALIPVYRIVKGKETLFSISNNVNKVSAGTVKKWNRLRSDEVANGSRLIVGYLKVKKELSPLAAKAVKVEINNEPIVEHAKLPIDNSSDVKTLPASKETIIAKSPDKPVNKTVATNKDVADNKEGGYFKSLYGTSKSHIANETGIAGIFKSTSGWEDGKYYCLHNSAAAGTIVKITSTATNKSVYAKVLDLIPDLKQNEGLVIRLSNAAAGELGMNKDKFECTLSY